MKRPSKRQTEAIKKSFQTNPLYFEEFILYLNEAREHEREMLEQCAPEMNEVFKGRCQMLTELSNNFKSLGPKGSSS